jgi:quinol monooxygenase YgiN
MQRRSKILFGAALAAFTMAGTLIPIQPARAQTPSQYQYVVVYGEFRPDANAIHEGTRTLDYLTRLARQSSGVVHFASYAEIGRPNFFSLIEIWQSAAAYTAFENASNTQKTLGNLQPYLIAPLDERDGNLVE